MAKIGLTREFSFEMAHALEGYNGACREIHGHSYRLFVTVNGVPCADLASPKLGMVMDFGELKSIVGSLVVDRFDHALLLRETPENQHFIKSVRDKWSRIELTPYQPTCENMVLFIVEQLSAALPENIELAEVKLYETERSCATWTASAK